MISFVFSAKFSLGFSGLKRSPSILLNLLQIFRFRHERRKHSPTKILPERRLQLQGKKIWLPRTDSQSTGAVSFKNDNHLPLLFRNETLLHLQQTVGCTVLDPDVENVCNEMKQRTPGTVVCVEMRRHLRTTTLRYC